MSNQVYNPNDPRSHKEIIALIKRISGQANFIGTPRIYVDMFDGDIVTAVWFNQVVYWDGKTENPIGFYKTYMEWKKELGLSRFQVGRAAKICQNRGLVNIMFRKVYGTPKNHYLVIWPELLKNLQNILNKPEVPETDSSETRSSEGEENDLSMEGADSSTSLSIEETPTKSRIEKIWESILEHLKGSMLGSGFDKYVRSARPISLDADGYLNVAVKDIPTLEWVEERLCSTIDRLLIGLVPDQEVRVKFVIPIEEPVTVEEL